MNELINKAKSLGIDLEVEKKHSKYTLLRTLNNLVKQFESSDITSYKIKSIIDGKTIVATYEDISNVDEVIDTLKSNILILDNDDADFLAKESIAEDNNDRINLDIEDIRKDLLSLNNYKEIDTNILNIDSILESNITTIEVINTNNIILKDQTFENLLYIDVSYKKDSKVSDSSDYYLFKEYKSEDAFKLFENVLKDSKKRIKEDSIKTIRSNVIINNNCMYLILNAFKDMFMAKNINKGISILSEKYGKQVFSPIINIVEDPLNQQFPGKRLFDSEGTKCIFKKIVDNGKFVTKLYDNRESLKDKVKSTANADGVNNMYLVPGNYTFEELIGELKNGIVITDLMGLHSGVNTITGDMSLDARGYLVENGKITLPLNSILLSANLFEIMNNVKYIGNDLKFGSTSVASPSILCENIMIVGEK